MDKSELCEKIRELYPQVGECGIDVDVDYDESKGAWIVELKKDHHELTTHLEPPDARDCVEGRECIALGLQIGQLVDNIKKL